MLSLRGASPTSQTLATTVAGRLLALRGGVQSGMGIVMVAGPSFLARPHSLNKSTRKEALCCIRAASDTKLSSTEGLDVDSDQLSVW